MNDFKRLSLENQEVIMDSVMRMPHVQNINGLRRQIEKTKEALAPASKEIGYEGDLKEGEVKGENIPPFLDGYEQGVKDTESAVSHTKKSGGNGE